MDPTPPPAADLPALYRAAVETGDAAELVRALCQVHGVSLRGLAELTGVHYQTLYEWQRGERRARAHTLRDVALLTKPTKTVRRRIEEVKSRLPAGIKGRPRKD